MNIRERFFQKIRPVDPGNPDACVVWTGGTNKSGYGRMKIEERDRKQIFKQAHHVSWFIKYGWWPERLMHTCDNPPCVKIGHLKEGTYQDNSSDMVAKGRQAKGAQVNSSKLTGYDVRKIRTLCETTNLTHTEIASRYGVDMMTVANIHARRAWAWLDPAPRPPRKKLRYDVGVERLTIDEIAMRAGVCSGTIDARIRVGKTGDALVARKHRAPRKPYTRQK